ncbi:hypothetical protein CcCBS67573_g08580 [Chytriomyces confervae]|uniref:PLOD1-3-like GT domain-containing protein n=1 Tax=Chytriomyces confervae TaxID=246404 RepID=A0A507EKC6_9FUNG|nr:hypothetical protein CcCBS67573_g08580 [Chytriomyces confervae]
MHHNLIPAMSDKITSLLLKPWRLDSTLAVALGAIAIYISVYFGRGFQSNHGPVAALSYNLSNGFDASQYIGSSTTALNSIQPPSNLRVITISTKGTDARKPMCKWTLFSAALNKIPLELYGSSKFFQKGLPSNKGKPEEGLATKRDCTLSALCAAAASSMNDAVLMIDAYDIIFQRPFEELQYLYYRRWNAPEFVVSAEENCYPSDVEDPVLPGVSGNGDLQWATWAKVVYENYKARPFMMDHLSKLSSAAYPTKPLYNEVEIGGRTYFVDASSKGIPMLIHLNGGIPKERATN